MTSSKIPSKLAFFTPDSSIHQHTTKTMSLLRTTPTRKLIHPSSLPALASPKRTYYSYETPLPPPYPPTETAILSSALSHVPITGWTNLSLRNGARDAGYLDVSTNLFPKAEFELVLYHLRTQRLGLKDKIQFPEEAKVGQARKVKSLVMERLRGNVEVDVQGRWQEVSVPPSHTLTTAAFTNQAAKQTGTRSHVPSRQHPPLPPRTLPPRRRNLVPRRRRRGRHVLVHQTHDSLFHLRSHRDIFHHRSKHRFQRYGRVSE
jgi:hypothetical protein